MQKVKVTLEYELEVPKDHYILMADKFEDGIITEMVVDEIVDLVHGEQYVPIQVVGMKEV